MKIYVLVASASEAKLYETTHLGEELDLHSEYTHPESREKKSDLVSDRPGHFADHTGVSRGAFVEVDPKEVEADRFAQQLAKVMLKLCNDQHEAKLVIMAAPHFHGLLNKHYPDQVKEQIAYKVEKDYTKTPLNQLVSHLSALTKLA